MLGAEYLSNITEDIVKLYADLQTDILVDIARRIRKTSEITETAAWQIERLNQAGLLRDEIITRIARINNTSRAEITKLFQQSVIKTRRYDDRIYRAAGLDPLPIQQSPAMLQILDGGLSKALGDIKNFTGTTALVAEQLFFDLTGQIREPMLYATNLAYQQVASGAFGYQTALRNAMDSLGREGIKSFEYASGRRISMEAGIRRNLLTGINQTAGQISHQTMLDMDCDLCETSAHQGARNTGAGFKNHAAWQGRVFSLKGATSKYPDFYIACGYGDVQGIYGANCRHEHYPFFEGISERNYSREQLDEYKNDTVTYNGETMSFYDATQRQREIERNIRDWKRRAAVKEAGGVDNTEELFKVKEWQSNQRDFIKQTGLTRDYIRERISK